MADAHKYVSEIQEESFVFNYNKMWQNSSIWEKTVINQNCIYEEITSRLNVENAYSVHNLLSKA
jgi:hypothetical protein